MKRTKNLRWLLSIPALLLLASVLAEIDNCHSAQMAIRQDLNDTILALAQCKDNQVARQDTIRRLEKIHYAMAQPLVMRADQRTPGALLALAVLSAMGLLSMGALSRESRLSINSTLSTNPVLTTSPAMSASSNIASLRLTPMQRRLVEMLASAPNHCVPKREICAALWGAKDNAEESLYTLVCRTKKALADTGAEIVCNRGESYGITLPEGRIL